MVRASVACSTCQAPVPGEEDSVERNPLASSRVEALPERRSPRLRAFTPIGLIEIVPHGYIYSHFPGNTAKTMLYGTGHHHLHPALSKKEHYGPGWAPVPARSV